MKFCRHGGLFFGIFIAVGLKKFPYLAEVFQIGCGDDYVVPMNGSCAWWASFKSRSSLK